MSNMVSAGANDGKNRDLITISRVCKYFIPVVAIILVNMNVASDNGRRGYFVSDEWCSFEVLF